MTRETFLAKRKLGIGGSDAASLFNVGYGCELRLWRDKRGEVPDFPLSEEDEDRMELGRLLEPFFADKYKRKTGRDVVVKDEPIVHPKYHILRVNVDRMVNDADQPERNVGVLEIKSVGRAVFYHIKRTGLPEDYILQLQHGILVTQSEWGSFCIGNRDSGQEMHWDVEADLDIQHAIVRQAHEFWAKVQNNIQPHRLEPDDPRCQDCEYRRSCQGNALIQLDVNAKNNRDFAVDESLRPLVLEYLERRALHKQADSLLDETREELKTKLGERELVTSAGRKIYFREQVSMLKNFDALAESYNSLRRKMIDAIDQHPELGPQHHRFVDEFPNPDTFVTPSPSRPLRIY